MKPLSAFRTQIMAQYLHGSGKFQILVQSVLLARKGSLLVYLRKQVSDSYRQALWSIHAAPTYLILCSRLHFTTILEEEEIIEIYIMFISVQFMFSFGPHWRKASSVLFPKFRIQFRETSKKVALKRGKRLDCNHLGASNVVSRRPKCCLSLTNIEEVVEM